MSEITDSSDVYCWVIREGDSAQMYCRDCVSSYIGDGDQIPVHEDHMAEGACVNCGAELTNMENAVGGIHE